MRNVIFLSFKVSVIFLLTWESPATDTVKQCCCVSMYAPVSTSVRALTESSSLIWLDCQRDSPLAETLLLLLLWHSSMWAVLHGYSPVSSSYVGCGCQAWTDLTEPPLQPSLSQNTPFSVPATLSLIHVFIEGHLGWFQDSPPVIKAVVIVRCSVYSVRADFPTASAVPYVPPTLCKPRVKTPRALGIFFSPLLLSFFFLTWWYPFRPWWDGISL